MNATETRALCPCGIPVFPGDDGVCGSCAREQRAELLAALREVEWAGTHDELGDDDCGACGRSRLLGHLKLCSVAKAIAKAEGSAD